MSTSSSTALKSKLDNIWYSIANFNYENQKDINRFVEYESTNNKEKTDRSASKNRTSKLKEDRKINVSQERKIESIPKETIPLRTSNLKYQTSRSPSMNRHLKSTIQVQPNIQLNYNTKPLENIKTKNSRASRNNTVNSSNDRFTINQQYKTVNYSHSKEIVKNITSPKPQSKLEWYEDPRYEKYLSREYANHNPDNYYHVKSKPVSKELGDILFNRLLQKQSRLSQQDEGNKSLSDIEASIPLSPIQDINKKHQEIKDDEIILDKNENLAKKDRYNTSQPVNAPPKTKLSIRNINLQVNSQEKPRNLNPTVISRENNFYINQESQEKRNTKNLLDRSLNQEDENFYRSSSFSQRENEKLNRAANLYRKGLEYEFSKSQNLVEAFKCYNEAGTLGHPEALFMLSIFYEKGKVVEKNITISRNYLEQSAVKGNINAASKLKNWIRCLICEEEEATSVFNPCLHKISCSECSEIVKQQFGDCPKCRVKIKKITHKN